MSLLEAEKYMEVFVNRIMVKKKKGTDLNLKYILKNFAPSKSQTIKQATCTHSPPFSHILR